MKNIKALEAEANEARAAKKAARSKQIDHEYTCEVVCPYCGETVDPSDSDYTFGYYWRDGAESDFECGDCSRKFSAQMNIHVTYTAKKIDQESEVVVTWIHHYRGGEK